MFSFLFSTFNYVMSNYGIGLLALGFVQLVPTGWALFKSLSKRQPKSDTQMQCFLSIPLQGNPSLHWMVVVSYWCSFCRLGSFKNMLRKHNILRESLIIAKHFLFQSFPLLETILVFALIIPSNSAQRNECSWLEWMLSHLSEGLTLGSHTEHFCHSFWELH